MVPRWAIAATALLLVALHSASAFSAPTPRQFRPSLEALAAHHDGQQPIPSSDVSPDEDDSRRGFLAKLAGSASTAAILSGNTPLAFADEGGDFESIAERAARVSREVAEAEKSKAIEEEAAIQRRNEARQKLQDDKRTIYDFTLPVGGHAREVAELVGQTFGEGTSGDGWTDGAEGGTGTAEGGKLGTRVKAILVVNIKQDDPIARKNIPECIALANK